MDDGLLSRQGAGPDGQDYRAGNARNTEDRRRRGDGAQPAADPLRLSRASGGRMDAAVQRQLQDGDQVHQLADERRERTGSPPAAAVIGLFLPSLRPAAQSRAVAIVSS